MILQKPKEFFPSWVLSLLKTHPFFYEICSLSLKNSWKETTKETWYSQWNKLLAQKNAPFTIQAWTFVQKQQTIEWELQIRFHSIEDQHKLLSYQLWIQLFPLWWYFFLLHPSHLHMCPHFPFQMSSSTLSWTDENKTYLLNRSLISFLKIFFQWSQVRMTLQYQYVSSKGWGVRSINPNYLLQDYLKGQWGQLETWLVIPMEVLKKVDPLEEWQTSPEVQYWISKWKENLSGSSQWQLLRRLQMESTTLDTSLYQTISLQKKRFKSAHTSRSQIFKGTLTWSKF